jgi:hypothetical protein
MTDTRVDSIQQHSAMPHRQCHLFDYIMPKAFSCNAISAHMNQALLGLLVPASSFGHIAM